MKNIIMLSAVAGVLTLSGCTSETEVVGTDTSATQDVETTQDNTAPVVSQNGMLVSSDNDMTLYTFDKDTMNKSNCVGDCSKAWPALTAPDNVSTSGEFTTIQRDDGTYQWATNGKPLYFFSKDMKAGDIKGDNKLDVWHIVPTQ